jgi:hypothetical protein
VQTNQIEAINPVTNPRRKQPNTKQNRTKQKQNRTKPKTQQNNTPTQPNPNEQRTKPGLFHEGKFDQKLMTPL